MATRVFNQKEKAVFWAIAEQSKRVPDEPFIYNVKEGQLFVAGKGVTLDRSEHLGILRKFEEDNVIDADWLVLPEMETSCPTNAICDFALNKDWSKKFIMVLAAATSDDYADFFFINIHPSEIKTTIDTFTTVCTANIVSAPDPLALIVRCSQKDANDEDYVIHTFKDGGRPHQTVAYALGNPGRPIFRQELNEKVRGSKGEELIKPEANIAKIFERNSTIKNELSPLIELNAAYVLVKQNVKLTKTQLEAIMAKARSN